MRLALEDRCGIVNEALAFFMLCAGATGDGVEPRSDTIYVGTSATWRDLAHSLISTAYRTPYSPIGDYMNRYWVAPEIFGERVRLHQTLRSDHDRVVHDHPWHFVSVILQGGYTEELEVGHGPNPLMERHRYRPGDVIFRHAEHRHRLELEEGSDSWSLVFTAPKSREWGFWPDSQFVPWRKFLDEQRTDAREGVPA